MSYVIQNLEVATGLEVLDYLRTTDEPNRFLSVAPSGKVESREKWDTV